MIRIGAGDFLLTGAERPAYAHAVAAHPHASLPPALRRLPRDLSLACAAGIGVGISAAAIAYAFYVHARGPTWTGVAIIPISVLIVAALYVGLGRRRLPRASDWVVLGYTAAMILSTVLLTVQQMVSQFFANFDSVVW